ncbi:hypothetical protein TH66_00205 [Carbonactinospora thermoautotrophica]|uniref:HTH gntR-type domain-containing protein n=1 Tax=Carbonactinospora thermoautotrophica TaxID=1469144 RepID=A0A132N3N7_9ACTN|nr:GntR family transcriptional regulator [Carbonactinospora thermoautotrophica]KWX04626.1 hypothetical protein TR74_24190 [Carbonactinospora thermoautotrophica]KWX05974.1 hypothetical protein TH66_00205 [Carbonactinospora thermoautotrophica]
MTPRPAPLYRRIADELRAAITSGELTPGTQLPTEQELGRKYRVSRNTVRLALGMLLNEGLIESTPGRGTFVRDHAVLTYWATRSEAAERRASSTTDAYVTDVREAGRTPSQRFEMRIVQASPGVAERLWVNEGDAVVLRRCLRSVDGTPWSIQDSYYPMDIAQGTELMSPGDIARGTIRVLAELGYHEVGFLDELIARMPNPDEASFFQVSAGVPVLVNVRTAYTTERPVRITETIFAGDRNRVVYELGDLQALYREREKS